MKVIIIGAGRIGRGFIAQLMLCNGNEITYFDASPEMVKLLNEKGEYTIHVLGNPDLDVHQDEVTAYLVNDAEKLADVWTDSDFIFTACGGKVMPAVGREIGEAFKILYERGHVHTSNIVTCENWLTPAEDLRGGVYSVLNEEEKKAFDENVGVAPAVIMCSGTGAPDDKEYNPMDTWVQDFKYLPIDRDRILGELPDWEYVEFVSDFGNMLTQKVYTNNTSVASCAFLGTLKGLKLVAEAANDSEIEPIIDQIYREINAGLIKGMGISEESQLKFQKRAKAKYKDWNIVDPLARIARDPIRKLGPDDRLIGPAKLALKVGVKPEGIALATAAALYYEDPNDAVAVEMKKMRDEHGVGYILENVSKLSPDDELYRLIMDSVDVLKQKGWLKV